VVPSGDLAHKDEDDYFWFEGRADDVILSSGYRIGPFEVESSLGEHEAVAEAAVVPKSHQERGNIVKAYIVPSEGATPSEDLKEDIRNHVRDELSAHEYPAKSSSARNFPRRSLGRSAAPNCRTMQRKKPRRRRKRPSRETTYHE